MQSIKQMYRPKEAAEYLGVSISCIWNYIAQNKLKARKLSSRVTVVSKADLDAFASGESEAA